MATLTASLKTYDRLAGPMRSIQKAGNSLLCGIEELNRTLQELIDKVEVRLNQGTGTGGLAGNDLTLNIELLQTMSSASLAGRSTGPGSGRQAFAPSGESGGLAAGGAALPLLQSLLSYGERVQQIIEGVSGAVQGVATEVQATIGQITNLITEAKAVAITIKESVSTVIAEIKALFGGITSNIGQVWAGITEKVAGLNELAVEVSGFINTITGAFGMRSSSSNTANPELANRALGTQAAATNVVTSAQWRLNAALLASPITWIVLIIIAIVAAIYIVVNAVNQLTGSTISATGIIAAVLFTLAAFIYNTIIVRIYNAFAALVNFLANVFRDPVAAIKILFLDLATAVIEHIRSIANAIQELLGKIGIDVDLTGNLDRMYDKIKKASNDIKTKSEWEEVVKELDYWNYGDAMNTGYDFGANLFSKDTESGGQEGILEGLNSNRQMSQIAANTGRTADSLSMAEEDVKYLRDIAERDAINRFTTAQLSVTMNTAAKIESDMDIDGVISQLENKTYETLLMAAEGV